MLYSLQKHGKKWFQLIEYDGEILINQKYHEIKIDMANVADRSQYYSSEFKKMRCEIQDCGKYQPCRIFVKKL